MLGILLKMYDLGIVGSSCRLFVHALVLILPFFHFMLSGDSRVLIFWTATNSAIAIHLLGHAVIARYHRETIDNACFYPFFGTIRLVNPPSRSAADIWITIAGPLANFIVGTILLFTNPTGMALFSVFYKMQFAYGLITLIPVFPFDGARLLRLVLLRRNSFERTLEISQFIGQSFAAALILWSFYQGFYGLGCIGIGIYLIARVAPMLQRVVKQLNESEIQADLEEFESEADGSDTVYLVEGRNGVWEAVDGNFESSAEPRWYV